MMGVDGMGHEGHQQNPKPERTLKRSPSPSPSPNNPLRGESSVQPLMVNLGFSISFPFSHM